MLHSVMRLERFKALPEYSCSFPTAPQPGFRFRRREPYRATEREAAWYLCEVELHANPELLGLRWTKLVVVEWAVGEMLAAVFAVGEEEKADG